MSTYNEYKTHSNSKIPDKEFIEKYWHVFKDEFNIPTASSEILEKVVKLSISNVLKYSYRISDIQRAVKL
jgi:hypothetical protein